MDALITVYGSGRSFRIDGNILDIANEIRRIASTTSRPYIEVYVDGRMLVSTDNGGDVLRWRTEEAKREYAFAYHKAYGKEPYETAN